MLILIHRVCRNRVWYDLGIPPPPPPPPQPPPTGTPYLLSLGLSKSASSLVWLAGPLSGQYISPLTISTFTTSQLTAYTYRSVNAANDWCVE